MDLALDAVVLDPLLLVLDLPVVVRDLLICFFWAAAVTFLFVHGDSDSTYLYVG